MGHDRHTEASSAGEINGAQKKTVNHIFQLACDFPDQYDWLQTRS